MKSKILCLLALLASLTGCVPLDSLNPLYTQKDTVFDRSLLGDWLSVNKESDDTTLSFVAVIENGKEVGYRITMSGKESDGKCSSIEFYGYAIDIGGARYLDLTIRNWENGNENQVYPLHVSQSKTGTVISPQFLHLAMASYMEFKGGAQVEARLHTAHWFAKVTRNDDKLRLDWIDDEVFKKAIAVGSFHLTHLLLGDGNNKDILVTASTQELQKFLAEHGNDPGLFTEHTDEVRKKSE